MHYLAVDSKSVPKHFSNKLPDIRNYNTAINKIMNVLILCTKQSGDIGYTSLVLVRLSLANSLLLAIL